jgi:GT2 family glycosyltransferase
MIEIVSATRRTEAEFWSASALGISLRRLGFDRRLVPRIAFENRRGLPEIYNARIDAEDAAAHLVFVHDDVWLDDYLITDRVVNGLRNFDVIGVAGNRRRVARQPAWAFVDDALTWDAREHLSGAVAHGAQPFGPVSWFGPSTVACELLDGVFLAASTAVLRQHAVRFDPRFAFHYYDMDFCRSARAAGLRLGTWPICITHQSGGAFGMPPWREVQDAYFAKWGD